MEILPSATADFDFASHHPFCCLTIRNDSRNQAKVFRIKVSDGSSYTIKPSRGLLRPRETIAIVARMSSEKRKSVLIRGDFVCQDRFALESTPVDDGFVEEYYKDRATLDSMTQCRRSLLQDVWLEPTTEIVKQPITAAFNPPPPYEITLVDGNPLRSCFRTRMVQTYKPLLLSPTPLRASCLHPQRTPASGQFRYWPFSKCGSMICSKTKLINASTNYMAYKFEQPEDELCPIRIQVTPSEGILSPRESIPIHMIVVRQSQPTDDEDILSSNTSEDVENSPGIMIHLASTPVQDPALLEMLMRGGKRSLCRMTPSYFNSRIWEPAAEEDIWIESMPCEIGPSPRRGQQDHFFNVDGHSRTTNKRSAIWRHLGCLFCHWTRHAPMTPLHFD